MIEDHTALSSGCMLQVRASTRLRRSYVDLAAYLSTGRVMLHAYAGLRCWRKSLCFLLCPHTCHSFRDSSSSLPYPLGTTSVMTHAIRAAY